MLTFSATLKTDSLWDLYCIRNISCPRILKLNIQLISNLMLKISLAAFKTIYLNSFINIFYFLSPSKNPKLFG